MKKKESKNFKPLTVINRTKLQALCGHTRQFYHSDTAQNIIKEKQKETHEGYKNVKE